MSDSAVVLEKIDPEHVVITEPVEGSEFPVHLMYIETLDGLYAPIGLRKPSGEGPFPVVLLASGNGGEGMAWVRDAVRNRGWIMERLLGAGYAVAWLRYRAEVELGYNKGGRLVQGTRTRRQLLSRSPLEYEDEISIIEYVKTLPDIDGNRVGLAGVSHAGEMILKLTSEYDGVSVGVACEPASHEFLVLSPDDTAPLDEETQLLKRDEMQMREVEKVRGRVDHDTAMKRIETINTPILVMGRETDHLQGIFRTTYELLKEAGKNVEWVSYDHPIHGYIFPFRGEDGAYACDEVQTAAIDGVIQYLDKFLKK